jgi:hypothetical protein
MKYSLTMKELIPTAGSLFVFLCITKAMIYYSVFGVRILDYITFTESLLLFFDDLLLLVLPVVCYIAYFFIFSVFSKKIFFLKKYVMINIYILSCGLVILYLIYLALLFINYFDFSILFAIIYLYLTLIVFLLPFFIIFRNFNQQRTLFESANNKNGLLLFQKKIVTNLIVWFVFISITGGGIQSLYKDLKNILVKDPEKIIKCEFKNGTTITSSKDTLYVGRAANNIFFYIPKSKKAFIYKNDELRIIEIQTVKKREQKAFDYF